MMSLVLMDCSGVVVWNASPPRIHGYHQHPLPPLSARGARQRRRNLPAGATKRSDALDDRLQLSRGAARRGRARRGGNPRKSLPSVRYGHGI